MIDYNTFRHEVFYFLNKKYKITHIKDDTNEIVFYFEENFVYRFSTLHLEHFYNVETNRGNGVEQAVDFFSNHIEIDWLRRIKK